MRLQRAITNTEGIVERNIALVTAFTRAVIVDPSLGAEIPKGGTLVLIPDDDPELAAYNRALGARAKAAGKTVYVRYLRGQELAAR